jgi:hypothetical protein
VLLGAGTAKIQGYFVLQLKNRRVEPKIDKYFQESLSGRTHRFLRSFLGEIVTLLFK